MNQKLKNDMPYRLSKYKYKYFFFFWHRQESTLSDPGVDRKKAG